MAKSQYFPSINKALNGLSFMAVFGFFLKPAWKLILENPNSLVNSARLYLFPFIGLTDLIRLLLTWNMAHKEKYKEKTTLIHLGIDAVTFVSVAAAITIGFTIGAIYTTVAPAIFTAILAFNALTNLMFGIYYGVKALASNQSIQKETFGMKRNSYLVNTFTHALAALAVGMILLAGKHLFAIAGIIGAAISTAHAVYTGYRLYKHDQEKNSKPHYRSSNAKLSNEYGIKAQNNLGPTQHQRPSSASVVVDSKNGINPNNKFAQRFPLPPAGNPHDQVRQKSKFGLSCR